MSAQLTSNIQTFSLSAQTQMSLFYATGDHTCTLGILLVESVNDVQRKDRSDVGKDYFRISRTKSFSSGISWAYICIYKIYAHDIPNEKA